MSVMSEASNSESSEESENNIVLDSSDSVSLSVSSTEDEESSTEDIQASKPFSDSAVVFSAKIENSEQATEILIEAEQFWHDGDGDSDQQEETLRTSLNLRVRKHLTS